jgi:DNA ligase-associated metallophosphoesterase
MKVSVNGEDCWLRPAGTLWLPQVQTLVVSDLHLEKGSSYAAKGQLLPPYDTRETLNRLMNEVVDTGAQRLVLLGDSLHDMEAISRIPVAEREAVLDLANGLELVWITGNHDPDGGAVFGGITTDTLQIGPLILRHEPLPAPADGEVAGHLHPCAKVVGAGTSVRRRCFASDGKRLILPAFGAYTGGLNVMDEAYAGLFEPNLCAYLTGHKITPVAYSRLAPDGRIRPARRRGKVEVGS